MHIYRLCIHLKREDYDMGYRFVSCEFAASGTRPSGVCWLVCEPTGFSFIIYKANYKLIISRFHASTLQSCFIHRDNAVVKRIVIWVCALKKEKSTSRQQRLLTTVTKHRPLQEISDTKITSFAFLTMLWLFWSRTSNHFSRQKHKKMTHCTCMYPFIHPLRKATVWVWKF